MFKRILNKYVLFPHLESTFFLNSKCGNHSIQYHAFNILSSSKLSIITNKNKYSLFIQKECIKNNLFSLKKNIPINYKKFIFVRNPFIRVFSSYNHFVKHNYFTKKISFKDFVIYYLKEYEQFDRHFISAKRLFEHEYVLKDIQVLHFEKFEYHLKKIIKYNYIINLNKSDSVLHYKNAYDGATKKVIEDLYFWDIKKLGYTFNSFIDKELPTIEELLETPY